MLGELPPTPRNVLAIRAVPGGIELTVPLGANVRTMRYGDKVVVDIDDTVANRPPLSPLTDIQPMPRREPGSAAARPDGNSQNVAPDAAQGQRSEPPPAPAETRPRENAPHLGEPPANAVTGKAAMDAAATGGAATGNAAAGSGATGSAAPGNAACHRSSLPLDGRAA
jgi:hypothetical protein